MYVHPEPGRDGCPRPTSYDSVVARQTDEIQGERDYIALPASTPKWKGNLPVGHMATYFQASGGKFGVAAVRWTQWLLRGNATASNFFTGTGPGTATADGWTAVSADLGSIKVTPLD
jgi:hypothetical protein